MLAIAVYGMTIAELEHEASFNYNQDWTDDGADPGEALIYIVKL